MTSEDWICGYVLLERCDEAQVAALLGGALSAPPRSERDACSISAPWPSVGRATADWAMVIDPHFEFGDSNDDLAQCSMGTHVARLMIIQRGGTTNPELFSHATAWANGQRMWDVWFEAALQDFPSLDGQVPQDITELARAAGSNPDPQTSFRIPVIAIERLTGWQARQPPNDPTPRFTALHHPRPAGVAAQVARDLTEQQ